MNKIKSIMCLSLCMATTLCAIPMNSSAEVTVKYGIMDISYAEFYASENIGYEVDAVTSATTSKWKNENLTGGSYKQPIINEDGEEVGGTILGVKYYVAVTDETLEAMGENNYNFTEVEEIPSAYKEVTLTEDGVKFSQVQGETSAIEDATATLSTSTVWGDYLIDVKSSVTEDGSVNVGTIYGTILTTTNGDTYAMRHLENIWRGEFAWSCGVTTQEPHGNTLTYEDFVSLSGQTIDTITYITETGYHVLDTNFYVPVKFKSTLAVDEVSINDGSTTITAEGFPEDYSKTYSIEGLEAEITDETITFNNAIPGSYTLVVSDINGKYADVSTSFVLYTSVIPATVKDNTIVKTNSATDEEFSNYLANLSMVTIGENTYNLSGRGAVKIINEDGTINLDVTKGSGEQATKIFSENGSYVLNVYSTGYDTPLQMMINVDNGNTIGISEYLRGDVNYDGTVDAVDLLYLKKYLLGMITW